MSDKIHIQHLSTITGGEGEGGGGFTKYSHERVLPDTLANILRKHLKQHKSQISRSNNYVCFALGHGAKKNHIGYNTISWFFNRFRHSSGLTQPYDIKADGKPQYRHASHTFRSLWITRLWNQTHDIALIQREIGHKETETTWGYIRNHDHEARIKGVINTVF